MVILLLLWNMTHVLGTDEHAPYYRTFDFRQATPVKIHSKLGIIYDRTQAIMLGAQMPRVIKFKMTQLIGRLKTAVCFPRQPVSGWWWHKRWKPPKNVVLARN